MNQDFTVQKKSNICLKKKNSCRAVHLKKKIPAQAVSEKKKFVQAENSPPHPPAPITFLMVRPLGRVLRISDRDDRMGQKSKPQKIVGLKNAMSNF